MNFRPIVAEFVGTALLLSAVVGSGIMAERLDGGNVAIALLANSIATGGALIAIILAFGPISGAHLNPAVRLADAWQRGVAWRDVPVYIGAQFAGAVAGVATANAMFGLPPFSVSHHIRSGGSQWLGEFVATFGHALRRRGLHRRRVLVYVVNVVRKPSRHDRTIAERHLRRHSPARCRPVPRRPARRRRRRDGALPVVRYHLWEGGLRWLRPTT